jgi:uncharacterized protein with von Willebrand factor type A (vWA) domain
VRHGRFENGLEERSLTVDERILQFIRALRATGVRVSVAESADALRAVEQVGGDGSGDL